MHKSESTRPEIRRVVVIPAYNEQDALPLLLDELMSLLRSDDLVLVIDDSSPETARISRMRSEEVAIRNNVPIMYMESNVRGGRGAAVRRGFELCLDLCPNANWFLECDADGSHRADDIVAILSASPQVDVTIGSRYLKSSRILGWTFSRRFQSRILNYVIPVLIQLDVTDITNGLRRYSRRAVDTMIRSHPTSSTFIYLTEQAMVLHQASMSFAEIPIVFAERRAGSSSVTWRELKSSLQGLLRVLRLRKPK